jgi:quinol monooxygenase YgiN
MSVLVIGKFQGDTAKFRQALNDRAAEFEKISAEAHGHGAVHHRFGIGDGFVMIIDEWQSLEQFQQFFSNPDLHAFIESVGANPGPPDITVAEAITSPDQF